MTAQVGVIGCGNMGAALIRGMLKGRRIDPKKLMAWDSDARKLERVSRALHFRRARSNRDVAGAAVILLAVKPQQMEEVLKEIRPCLTHRPLVVSIAAGIPIRWIEDLLGPSVPVVRMMPNTPALVGAGIAAIAAGRAAGAKDVKRAQEIFECVGEVVRVPEKWMNAVTAVSGSGPAYFFYLMEQMVEAGVALGLSREVALKLVIETAHGAAALARVSDEDASTLRSKVTSKGGTTEAALRVFARLGVGRAIQAGVRAAAARARQLGGKGGRNN